jgi:hypothetical protein
MCVVLGTTLVGSTQRGCKQPPYAMKTLSARRGCKQPPYRAPVCQSAGKNACPTVPATCCVGSVGPLAAGFFLDEAVEVVFGGERGLSAEEGGGEGTDEAGLVNGLIERHATGQRPGETAVEGVASGGGVDGFDLCGGDVLGAGCVGDLRADRA